MTNYSFSAPSASDGCLPTIHEPNSIGKVAAAGTGNSDADDVPGGSGGSRWNTPSHGSTPAVVPAHDSGLHGFERLTVD